MNEMKKEDIKSEMTTLQKSMNVLQRLAHIEAPVVDISDNQIADTVVSINGNRFVVVVKNKIMKSNFLPTLQALRAMRKSLKEYIIIIVKYISPQHIQDLFDDGFSVLEESGNCMIAANNLFISIQGQKQIKSIETYNKAFNETGVKLIFFFLHDKDNVAKPYREISAQTGISLGSIKNVIEELAAKRFIAKRKGKRFIINRERLISQWQEAYNRTLKPKLFIGRMKLVDKNQLFDLNEVILPKDTCWAGESGAYIYDKFLQPEECTLYTDLTMEQIATSRLFIPDVNGNVVLYQKFWGQKHAPNLAPKIIIYADLMGSGNSRCLEAANKILESGI